MPKIGSLSTSLTLESQSFFVELKKVHAQTSREIAAIQRTLSGVASGLKTAFALAGGGSLIAMAKSALDYAGSLGEVSQQLGVTSRDLQIYRYIGTQVGIEQGEMDKGLQRLTRSMGEADAGSKKQATAFREMGVSVHAATGELLTAGQVLPHLADAFAQIRDPATRARLETQLFGKTGQQLDPLLTQGAKGVEALTKRADELGIVLGDDLIKAADTASDRLAELQMQLQSKFARTMAENANLVLQLADALSWAATKANQFFVALRGNERIGKEEGFIASIEGMGDSFAAGTPQGWFDRKQKQAKDAREAADRIRGSGAAKWVVDQTEAIARQKEHDQAAAFRDMLRAGGVPVSRPERSGQGALPTAKGGGGRGKKDNSAKLAAQREELALEQQIARAEAQGDKDREAALREQLELKQLAGKYEQAGLTKEAALKQATQDRNALMWDNIAARIKAVQIAEDERALEIAQERGDWAEVTTLQRQKDLRERIAFWQEKGRNLAEATRNAEVDLLHLDQARAEAKQRLAAADERARQLELARARGDSPARIHALEQDDWIRQRTDTLVDQGKGLKEPEARAQAEREALESNQAFAQGYWRDTMKGGIRAALDGNFGDWFENWWKDRLSSALEDALNSVSDLIARLFKIDVTGTPGGGAGDFLSGLLGRLGIGGGGSWDAGVAQGYDFATNIPGLAGGGSFKIGGNSGIDQNILSINDTRVARVSATERVRIEPDNARGSRANGNVINIDMRGSFVPEDIVERARSAAAGDTVRFIGKSRRSAALAQRHNLG